VYAEMSADKRGEAITCVRNTLILHHMQFRVSALGPHTVHQWCIKCPEAVKCETSSAMRHLHAAEVLKYRDPGRSYQWHLLSYTRNCQPLLCAFWHWLQL
jgi:hypothetical protein